MRAKEFFICGECEEFHDWPEDASMCCAPPVKHAHQCSVCGLLHHGKESFSEADRCCSEPVSTMPEGISPPQDAEQLEAAGQLRIF